MSFIVTFSIRDHSNNLIVITDSEFNIVKGSHSFDCQSGLAGCVCIDKKIYVNDMKGVVVLDTNLNILERIDIGNANHGMAYNEFDDRIYIVASGEGIVYGINRKTLEVEYEFTRRDVKSATEFHINSIDFYDKDIFALTVHNRIYEGYVELRSLKDPYYSFPIMRKLQQPHDFKFLDKRENGVIVNDSKASCIVCNKSPIEKSWCTQLQNYVRGLAFDDFYVYAGTSTNHSRIHHDNIAKTIDNVIFKLNIESGEIVSKYSLNTLVGKEIYSVTYIGENEFES